MDNILSQIKDKDGQLRDLGNEIERAGTILPQMRAEKKEITDQKRRLDDEVRTLQRNIAKKKEELNAKKSTIKHFYSDQQFAKTISNLQRLLERNSFPLSEEKKYVQEINSLNRSKKQMTEYSVVNEELQKLLDSKKSLQEQVDTCYRTISQMHGQIRDRERKLNQLHIDKETIKKELDKLYYEKHLKEQFRRKPPSGSTDQPDFKSPADRPSKPGNQERNHGNQERSHGNQERNHGNQERSHGNQERTPGNADRTPSNLDRSHGNPDRSHGNPDRNHGNPDRSHGNPDRNHGNPDRSHGNADRSHGSGIERRHSERFHGHGEKLSPGSRSMSQDVFSSDPERRAGKLQLKRKTSFPQTSRPAKPEPVKEAPYLSELQLCDTLIQYCTARLPAEDLDDNTSPSTSSDASLTSSVDDGLYLLPKKRSDEPRYGSTVVRRSSSKKSKKDRQKMKMVHNLETLSQFATVMLNPPSTHSELPATLNQLKERKVFYESAAAGLGLDSENTSPCSTGTLEDFLQRDSLEEAAAEPLVEDPADAAGAEAAAESEPGAAEGEEGGPRGAGSIGETVVDPETSPERGAHPDQTPDPDLEQGAGDTLHESDLETSDNHSEGVPDAPEGDAPPPEVCLDPPTDPDDETESGICSNTESIGAYSRSNSNSDCEPREGQEQVTASILGELQETGRLLQEQTRRQEALLQEDLVLDDNSNLDLDKTDPSATDDRNIPTSVDPSSSDLVQ